MRAGNERNSITTIFKLLKLNVSYKNIVDFTINCYVKCYDHGKELIVDIDEPAMEDLLGLDFEGTFKVQLSNRRVLLEEFLSDQLYKFDRETLKLILL